MANDILTLSRYKQIKKMTKTDDDIKLSLIISSVNNLIKTYIGRNLLQGVEPIEEYITLDYDTDVIFPDVWPITSIESITEVPLGYTYDSTVHLPLNEASDYITVGTDRIYRTNGYWPQGPNSVRIVYNAGYETVPEELELAAVELVDYYFKEQYLQSRVSGNTTITNLVPNTPEFPPHVRLILDRFSNG